MGFTSDHHIQIGSSSKLTLEQHVQQFILYMKHDNVSMYDALVWNWSKSAMCDDDIFIASCINDAIGDEIQ